MTILILKAAACLIASYLIGSISFATIISNRYFKDDVRSHGSGNAGSTNMLRTYGWKAAGVTLLLDAAKGALSVGGSMLICGDLGALVGAVGVIVGHNWPIFFKFKGGKGVAATIGALLVIIPWQTLIVLAICAVIIAATKIVSIASIVGGVLSLIMGIIFTWNSIFKLLAIIVMVVFLIFQHRGNIQRLINKSENTI